jgi:hypothetical protein
VEAGAVGQTGQGVLERLLGEPLFELLALGDVAQHDQSAGLARAALTQQ